MTGRPTKCDAATMAAIVARVRAGVHIVTAAEAEGVSARSVSRWMNADEEDETYGEFRRSVARARAQHLADRVQVVTTAATAIGRDSDGVPIMAPDPKMALAQLAVDDPDGYAPSQTIVIKARSEAVAETLALLRDAAYPLRSFADVVALLAPGDDDEDRAEH